MTHAEKVRKLANAIRRYRGIYDYRSGNWKSAPQIHDQYAVGKWLQELRLDPFDIFPIIDGFKTLLEFNKWIAKL